MVLLKNGAEWPRANQRSVPATSRPLLIFLPAQTARAAKRGVRVAWMCSYLRLMPDDKALGWQPKQPAPSNIE
jgi:hypothetical protein